MNPDKTAPKEQSDLGPYCLQYRLQMSRAHRAISHCNHLLLKMYSGYKYKSLAKIAV